MPLDPRLNAFRDDLADARLAGQVKAAGFVEGRPAEVVRGLADLRRAPDPESPLDTQLWRGDRVQVFEETPAWSWVQNERDGYVGYLASAALGAPSPEPSHKVSVNFTFLFPRPDLKTPPLDRLPMGARVTVEGSEGDYCSVGNGWVYRHHLRALDAPAEDWVAVAEGFLGVPYLWGGSSAFGIDCSALIQVALDQAGIAVPRDSGQQEPVIGESLPLETERRRGDLLFFPGHVAIALDQDRILNATGGGLMVKTELLAALLPRVFEESGGSLRHLRRLPAGTGHHSEA